MHTIEHTYTNTTTQTHTPNTRSKTNHNQHKHKTNQRVKQPTNKKQNPDTPGNTPPAPQCRPLRVIGNLVACKFEKWKPPHDSRPVAPRGGFGVAQATRVARFLYSARVLAPFLVLQARWAKPMLSRSRLPPRAMGVRCSSVMDMGSGALRVSSIGELQRQHVLLLASHFASMSFLVALPASSACALRSLYVATLSGLRIAHRFMLARWRSLLSGSSSHLRFRAVSEPRFAAR